MNLGPAVGPRGFGTPLRSKVPLRSVVLHLQSMAGNLRLVVEHLRPVVECLQMDVRRFLPTVSTAPADFLAGQINGQCGSPAAGRPSVADRWSVGSHTVGSALDSVVHPESRIVAASRTALSVHPTRHAGHPIAGYHSGELFHDAELLAHGPRCCRFR